MRTTPWGVETGLIYEDLFLLNKLYKAIEMAVFYDR